MSISNRAHETVRDDSVPAPTAPKSGNSAGMAGGAPARIALRPADAATTLGISRRKSRSSWPTARWVFLA